MSGWTLMLVMMVSIVLKVGWLEDGRIAYQLAERDRLKPADTQQP